MPENELVTNPLKVGDKVHFATDKRPFTVRAVGGQFAICTKPLNVLKTVLYTIIDFEQGIRGPNDLVFNMYDYTNQAEIDTCLKDLMDPEVGLEVSSTRRRGIDLDIVKVNGKPYGN